MNLYGLITNLNVPNDYFYVVANDPNEAKFLLEKELDKSDYGFDWDREVITINLIAKELTIFPKVANFSSRNKKLLISGNKYHDDSYFCNDCEGTFPYSDADILIDCNNNEIIKCPYCESFNLKKVEE